MSQIALDLPQFKNGNGKHGRRNERKLAADLHEIAELRAEIYRHAGGRGVTPTMLLATRKLMRK